MDKPTLRKWKVAKVERVLYPVNSWRSVGGKTERCADPTWIFMEDYGAIGVRTFNLDRNGNLVGELDTTGESEAVSTIANNYLLDPQGWIDIPAELVARTGWIASSWLAFACGAFERQCGSPTDAGRS